MRVIQNIQAGQSERRLHTVRPLMATPIYGYARPYSIQEAMAAPSAENQSLKVRYTPAGSAVRHEPCEVCSMSVGNMQRHLQRMHRRKFWGYQCSHCGFGSSRLDGNLFKKHLKCHNVMPLPISSYEVNVPNGYLIPIRCSSCPFNCLTTTILERHQKENHRSAFNQIPYTPAKSTLALQPSFDPIPIESEPIESYSTGKSPSPMDLDLCPLDFKSQLDLPVYSPGPTPKISPAETPQENPFQGGIQQPSGKTKITLAEYWDRALDKEIDKIGVSVSSGSSDIMSNNSSVISPKAFKRDEPEPFSLSPFSITSDFLVDSPPPIDTDVILPTPLNNT